MGRGAGAAVHRRQRGHRLDHLIAERERERHIRGADGDLVIVGILPALMKADARRGDDAVRGAVHIRRRPREIPESTPHGAMARPPGRQLAPHGEPCPRGMERRVVDATDRCPVSRGMAHLTERAREDPHVVPIKGGDDSPTAARVGRWAHSRRARRRSFGNVFATTTQAPTTAGRRDRWSRPQGPALCPAVHGHGTPPRPRRRARRRRWSRRRHNVRAAGDVRSGRASRAGGR